MESCRSSHAHDGQGRINRVALTVMSVEDKAQAQASVRSPKRIYSSSWVLGMTTALVVCAHPVQGLPTAPVTALAWRLSRFSDLSRAAPPVSLATTMRRLGGLGWNPI
jgi:hypothetical protein